MAATAVNILKSIMDGDADAAEHLYHRYAVGIRSYLRRHTGRTEVEQSVLTILIRVSRHAREGRFNDDASLTRDVLLGARKEAARLQTLSVPSQEPPNATPDHVKLADSVLQERSDAEREVLLRSYLLEQEPDVIARQMNIPLAFVTETRCHGRTTFRRLREGA